MRAECTADGVAISPQAIRVPTLPSEAMMASADLRTRGLVCDAAGRGSYRGDGAQISRAMVLT
jgi:hypothetical protein